MNLLEAESRLRKIGVPFLTTGDVAASLGITKAHASNSLRRLEKAGKVTKLMRGRWLVGDEYDPLAIAQYLTAPLPSYISLHTALFHHGMISQIPSITYAITLARTARFTTPVGEFSLHRIDPGFFFGFEPIGKYQVKMAIPEKALLDFLYLFPTRSRLFRALPELELPSSFSEKRAIAMINELNSRSKQSLVRKQFDKILNQTRLAA